MQLSLPEILNNLADESKFLLCHPLSCKIDWAPTTVAKHTNSGNDAGPDVGIPDKSRLLLDMQGTQSRA